MSPRTSAFDQIGEVFSRALVCLATHRRFNFSRMIFEAMFSNFLGLRKNYKFMMYPRFVQMIINTLLPNLENDGVELPLETMQEVIFSSMNNVRKTSKFSGTVTPLFPYMLQENPDPDFNLEDEIDDLMAEDIDDGINSDNDENDHGNNDDQGNDDDQGHDGGQRNVLPAIQQKGHVQVEEPRVDTHMGEYEASDLIFEDNRVPEVNEELTEPLLSHTEEFIAETEDILSVNTEVLKVPDEQLTATTTIPSKKRKEPEKSKTVPSRPPPSKGIMFTDPELRKKKKTIITALARGKGSAKEVPKKHKSKKSKSCGLVDEEFFNYATRETADVVSQLKTQISNLQSREAANTREIRELKTESNKQKAQIGAPIVTNQEENVEDIQSPAATEPIPSTGGQVQTPVSKANMYEDSFLFDVDMLLNDEGEGLERTNENQEETEKEEEDVEEVEITGERKYDNDPSDDDNNSVIGKKDKLVDEQEPFTVPEDVEPQVEKSKTSKIDKTSWWTVTEKPSIVEKITQTIKSPEQVLTGEILAWMYDDDKKMYVIKRGDGNIQYFDRSSKMKTLPYWDIRELSKLKLIKSSNNTFATNFEEYLKKECGKDKLKRKDKNGKKKIQDKSPEFRVFDPVYLFSLSDEDLRILYKNLIRCDMSTKIKAEAKLYMRVVARCLSRRHEAKVIKKRLAALDAKKLKVKVKTKLAKDHT
ncbi:hypothetical protein L1987_85875 [Smallanthus sonchifolius]|uniref:Uncharacterized protein n=1 Tax=Smallanthus sonchifolius TaxID=185202 RepID=A0ACB8XYD9_9ASTR|nr:hypothetical protein L1987_85875 [Smallanthus sonchifolius]